MHRIAHDDTLRTAPGMSCDESGVATEIGAVNLSPLQIGGLWTDGGERLQGTTYDLRGNDNLAVMAASRPVHAHLGEHDPAAPGLILAMPIGATRMPEGVIAELVAALDAGGCVTIWASAEGEADLVAESVLPWVGGAWA